MISFAKRMASAIALTVAGIRGVLEYRASLRAARIAAAINRTRLRPSSTEAWYTFRLLFVYACFLGLQLNYSEGRRKAFEGLSGVCYC